jgi:hypothetical protein
MSNYKVTGSVGEMTRVGIPVGSVTVYERDATGKILWASGATVPNAVAGYAVGAKFDKKSGGSAGTIFVNMGTTASCSFVRSSPLPRSEWGCVEAKVTACSTGVTAFTTPTKALIKVTDIVAASYGASDDQDQLQLMSISAEDTILGKIVDPLAAHSIAWAAFRQGGPANFEVFAAGQHTTVGGQAAEVKAVAGVLASDVVLAQVMTLGTGSRTLGKAVPTANTITFTFSGDPVANHVVSYVVLRPAGSFRLSHYVFAAGTFTAITGSATQTIAVTGLLATDVVIVTLSVTDDTDNLVTASPAAGAITVVESADPLAAHAYSYVVLRAL